MIPEGLYWNQAELPAGHRLDWGLVSVIAFDAGTAPFLIGTAFIVAAAGRDAVACTAAHNFEAVRRAQAPPRAHHPSALSEFLPSAVALNIDRTKIRAVSSDHGRFEMATLSWAIWDPDTDIAFFGLRPQHEEDVDYFQSSFLFDDELPKVGDEVAALGYAGMEIRDNASDGASRHFTVARQPLLRVGRVTSVCMDGHILCRGPCFETTVPFFPGMSGGPVMRMAREGPMKPFGIISSDPASDSHKQDRSIRGYGAVALLCPMIRVMGEQKQDVAIGFRSLLSAGIDLARLQTSAG